MRGKAHPPTARDPHTKDCALCVAVVAPTKVSADARPHPRARPPSPHLHPQQDEEHSCGSACHAGLQGFPGGVKGGARGARARARSQFRIPKGLQQALRCVNIGSHAPWPEQRRSSRMDDEKQQQQWRGSCPTSPPKRNHSVISDCIFVSDLVSDLLQMALDSKVRLYMSILPLV
jgi:hypothetical protein